MAQTAADQYLRLMKHGYKISVEPDVLTGIIVILAILLFAGTGGTVLTDAINALLNNAKADDNLLVSAFLLKGISKNSLFPTRSNSDSRVLKQHGSLDHGSAGIF